MKSPALRYKINKVNGISVYINKSAEPRVDACQITINGTSLDILKKTPGITIADLRRQLDPTLPCAVNFTGRGTIIRKVSRITQIDAEVFASIFPNTDFDDFYVQLFISGQTGFVAAIRKKEAEIYLALLAEQGFSPTVLSLGPFVFQVVAGQFNHYDPAIVFSGHQISRDEEKQWTDYRFDESSRSQFPIKIGNEKLDEDLVLPYAAAFQLSLSDESNLTRVNHAGINAGLKKMLARENFKLHGFVILLLFFVILIANFLYLMSLNKENENLDTKVNIGLKNVQDLKLVNEKVVRYEQLVDSLGWDGGLFKSTMIDQSAALKPSGIILYDVSVSPVYQPQGGRQPDRVSFLNRQMILKGSADAIIPVNEWVARIKSVKWVRSAELSGFNFNHELNTGLFTIRISY